MKDKFIEFLKNEGVYDKFMEEFEKDNDYKDIDNKWWRIVNGTE